MFREDKGHPGIGDTDARGIGESKERERDAIFGEPDISQQEWEGITRPPSAPAALVNKGKSAGYSKGKRGMNMQPAWERHPSRTQFRLPFLTPFQGGLDLSVDANYFNYYYSQKPLDPRLPSPALARDFFVEKEGMPWNLPFEQERTGAFRNTNLVASIQEDFPQTPSQAFGAGGASGTRNSVEGVSVSEASATGVSAVKGTGGFAKGPMPSDQAESTGIGLSSLMTKTVPEDGRRGSLPDNEKPGEKKKEEDTKNIELEVQSMALDGKPRMLLSESAHESRGAGGGESERNWGNWPPQTSQSGRDASGHGLQQTHSLTHTNQAGFLGFSQDLSVARGAEYPMPYRQENPWVGASPIVGGPTVRGREGSDGSQSIGEAGMMYSPVFVPSQGQPSVHNSVPYSQFPRSGYQQRENSLQMDMYNEQLRANVGHPLMQSVSHQPNQPHQSQPQAQVLNTQQTHMNNMKDEIDGIYSQKTDYQNKRKDGNGGRGASDAGRTGGNGKDHAKRRGRGRHDGVVRSKLLEEFRSNKSKKYHLSDIRGSLVEFSGDQHGSRFIQQKIESATLEEKEFVFSEIYPHVLQLMTDVFGNYVVQKLFQHGTADQQQQLGLCLKGRVLDLSLQMYGCRVVQKALSVIPVDLKVELAEELKDDVLVCVKDQNGNHVVQKCIETIPSDRMRFIVDPFVAKVNSLATHPYGCRVIQRLLENCSSHMINIILEKLLPSTLSLVQDQYGNYVVQHFMEYGTPEEKALVVEKLRGNILKLSTHKFASNVVEKCIEFGTYENRKILIEEILDVKDFTDKQQIPLMIMMKDQYANYVVQRMLDVSDKKTRERLLKQIKPLIPLLKKYTYGRHIINFLDRYKLSGEKE